MKRRLFRRTFRTGLGWEIIAVTIRYSGKTMTRKQICFLVVTALLCVAAADQPKHLVDANTLVDNISQKNNVYAHKDCFIKWKGEDGATQYENRTDCSDFLAQLVMHSYGVTPAQLKSWTGHTRPMADHWHDAIVAEKGFTQIKNLSDALPGDVLAVKFPKGLADTGHIMMVAEMPVAMTATAPIEPGTTQWKVTIIDSTKFPHGPGDTREPTASTGVGRGVIRIYTDSSGAVAGYTWSEGTKAKFEVQSDRNMVIGRLTVKSE